MGCRRWPEHSHRSAVVWRLAGAVAVGDRGGGCREDLVGARWGAVTGDCPSAHKAASSSPSLQLRPLLRTLPCAELVITSLLVRAVNYCSWVRLRSWGALWHCVQWVMPTVAERDLRTLLCAELVITSLLVRAVNYCSWVRLRSEELCETVCSEWCQQ